jgi:hypothetical protein
VKQATEKDGRSPFRGPEAFLTPKPKLMRLGEAGKRCRIRLLALHPSIGKHNRMPRRFLCRVDSPTCRLVPSVRWYHSLIGVRSIVDDRHDRWEIRVHASSNSHHA